MRIKILNFLTAVSLFFTLDDYELVNFCVFQNAQHNSLCLIHI